MRQPPTLSPARQSSLAPTSSPNNSLCGVWGVWSGSPNAVARLHTEASSLLPLFQGLGCVLDSKCERVRPLTGCGYLRTKSRFPASPSRHEDILPGGQVHYSTDSIPAQRSWCGRIRACLLVSRLFRGLPREVGSPHGPKRARA